MKTLALMNSIGFKVNQPKFVCYPLTSDLLKGINSRDFGKPYSSMEEQIAGNLYLWLQQSYSVLWAVNSEPQVVNLYHNTIDKLGERFATLLRFTKDEGKAAALEMIKALALSNFILEDVIFKIEGNWLMKYRNPVLNGLLKHFMFWMASVELAAHENALKCLGIFIKKFAKDVDLQKVHQYPQESIMDAFLQCFFHGNNSREIFFLALQNPNLSFQEIK
jgi:hypothetical protein